MDESATELLPLHIGLVLTDPLTPPPAAFAGYASC